MAHTPGPWTTDDLGRLIGADGTQVLVYNARFAFGMRSESSEANTRLMEAAPKMLEALKLVRAMRGEVLRECKLPQTSPWSTLEQYVDKAIHAAEGR